MERSQTAELQLRKSDIDPVKDGFDWNSVYKVYASVEFNREKTHYSVDIIDGFLNNAEKITLKSTTILSSGKTRIIQLEVSASEKLNTYLRTSEFELSEGCENILVLVFKNGYLKGYQWIDFNNNLLGEPEYFNQRASA